MLEKRPEEISLMDVINCTESTMAISRCLEKDGYCSRNYSDCCKVHKVLLDLQNTYNNRLENVKISDIIQPGKDEYFGRFYVVIKLNLKDQTYECIYSHVHEVYDKVSASASYGEFVKKYTEQYVHEQDRQKLQEFLASEKLTEHLVDGCMEEDMSYRRICDNEADSYIWMEAKRYVDETENTAILTFHNAKVIPDTIVNMEQELRKKEKNITKQYWDMVSLLVAVLNHNNLVETEHQDDISFYTEQVYRQLQKNYPEYGITEEEIENVSHLAPIHDIGKIRVSIEILNKNGKLTIDEMEVVKQHPITGAEMTLRFPNGVTTEKLNEYSYEICRHHHERFDGSGYPDGLKGDQIPICAQVVGLVDAYDALVSERPYKRKLRHGEAVRMIINGECGAFSMKLLQCFLAAAMQKKIIAVLLIAVGVFAIILGIMVCNKLRQPQNYIEAVDPDSVEMKTAELLSGIDGTMMFRYNSKDTFQALYVYLSEYHSGKRVSHKRVLELSYEDVKSAKNGLIVITPDFDNFTAKLIAADEYSKYMTETPILEGVANREYYGRSATSIENKSTIEYGTGQGLAALIYGEQGVSSLPIQDITGEYIDTDNEYMYYYSAEFVK